MNARINHLLHVLRWIPMVIVTLAVLQTLVWAFDREPPFRVIEGRVIPPAHVGGALRIEGRVERDVTRGCYLRVIHWIEDSKGFRHFLPVIGLTAESIRKQEEVTPGRTKYLTTIASQVSPGPAEYHAENVYVCNPLNLVWPIVVVTRLPFEVQP